MRITRHAIRTYDSSGRDRIYSWTDDTLILTAAIAAFDELIARCCCRGSILQSRQGQILGLAGTVFRYMSDLSADTVVGDNHISVLQ